MKRSPFASSRRASCFARSCHVLTGVALLGLASHASAVLNTWTGGGADGSWQTAGNWLNGVPANSDTELFNNATNTAVTFANRTQSAGITWDTGAGSFTYSPTVAGSLLNPSSSGSSFTINAGVTGQTETFIADVQLFVLRTTPATITFADNSTTSGFVFTNMYGDVSAPGIAATIAFRGSGAATVGSTVNGVISDHNGTAGGNIIVQKTGGAASALTLNGANTYSGGTDIASGSGVVTAGNKSAFGTGQIRVNNGGGNLQSNTALTGANAIANQINYLGTTGTATTTTAAVTFTPGSNVGTLTGGVAPAVGDLVAQGGALPAFTVVTAVNGAQITFSQNAVSTATTATLTTNPFTGSGTSTVIIGGTNNVEFSGSQFLTSALSNGTAATQTFNVINTGRTTFSGVLQEQATALGTTGSASIIKTGTGLLALTAANTYTGTTTVSGGTLLANNTAGSATGVGAVTVNAGNILGGTGIVGGITGATGAVTNNGFLSPGDATVNGGIGTLTIGSTGVNRNTVFGANSALTIQVGVGTSDRLTMFGNLDLSGTTDTLAITGTLDGVTNYVIATYTGTLAGTFNTVTGLTGTYVVQYNANNITLAVPEPGSVAMVVVGLGMLVGMQYRRRRTA